MSDPVSEIDPSNIKALTNEELTKLILVSNRAISQMATQINGLQTQLNELSQIILDARISDHHLDLSGNAQEPIVEPAPTPQTLPVLPLTPVDFALMGVSLSAEPTFEPSQVQEEPKDETSV